MQGTQVEPGTSQFRRPWATIVTRRISTNMMRTDLIHSRLFMLLPSTICAHTSRVPSPAKANNPLFCHSCYPAVTLDGSPVCETAGTLAFLGMQHMIDDNVFCSRLETLTRLKATYEGSCEELCARARSDETATCRRRYTTEHWRANGN